MADDAKAACVAALSFWRLHWPYLSERYGVGEVSPFLKDADLILHFLNPSHHTQGASGGLAIACK